MIKTLLNADEEPPPGTKVTVEETVVNPLPEMPSSEVSATEESVDDSKTRQTFEIPEDAKFFAKPSESITATIEETPPSLEVSEPESEAFTEEVSEPEAVTFADKISEPVSDPVVEEVTKVEPESTVKEVSEVTPEPIAEDVSKFEPESFIETEKVEKINETVNLDASEFETKDLSGFEPIIDEKINDETPPIIESPGDEKIEEKTNDGSLTIFQNEYKTPTTAETVRQSGLAWSAGIVFFGSIVFMMIFGWFADLLIGSSPWGLVGGIVLGAIIGFVQFFRITSQIFKK